VEVLRCLGVSSLLKDHWGGRGCWDGGFDEDECVFLFAENWVKESSRRHATTIYGIPDGGQVNV